MRNRAICSWCWIFACAVLLTSSLARAAPSFKYGLLEQQISQADAKVDFLAAKLVVDRLIDSSINQSAVLLDIDSLVQSVRERTPTRLTPRDRMDVLLSTLYTAGSWNGYRPFQYDLNDPLGKDWRNKLLSTYLRTRKGNCISMPILVAIVGQRLGLTITLSTAPQHVLVKFADGRTWLNVEATANGYKWDSSYERDLEISSTAIQNEIYLRPLTRRQAVGVMAHSLMERLNHTKRADDLMTVADLVLENDPKDTTAMVQKANAYYLQLQEVYVKKYKNIREIPKHLQNDYRMRSQANLDWFTKAEALGWMPPTAANTTSYLNFIEHQRTQRGNQQ